MSAIAAEAVIRKQSAKMAAIVKHDAAAAVDSR
jgi:hypothetical protein